MQYVQVPDDRLCFVQGDNKERLEQETGANINIDSQSKTVSVTHTDSVQEFDVARTLRAISSGFEPKTALQLFYGTHVRFEKIDIRSHTRNEKEFNRQKGRIIGKNGRTRELISELTSAHITVYDNFVGIIGDMQDAKEARRAVLKLLDGTPHAHVYETLEQYKKRSSSPIPLKSD